MIIIFNDISVNTITKLCKLTSLRSDKIWLYKIHGL